MTKLTQKQLDALEYGRRGGYWKHTEKTKKKLSKQKIGNKNPMFGKKGKKHCRWTRKKLICDNCGGDIFRPKCLLKRNKHNFCCIECKRRWQFENRKTRPYYYYGNDWLKIRNKILERDNFKCVNCGNKKTLEIHHKERWLDSKNNGEENLITLCRKCHRKIESENKKCN